MSLASTYRKLSLAGNAELVRTLAIACGTGINATVVPTKSVAIGVLSEAGKIPMNVMRCVSPEYPFVANAYMGLKRVATRISELIGCKDQFKLEQYTVLLEDSSIRSALGQLDAGNSVWDRKAVGGLLSRDSVDGLSSDDLFGQLVRLRPFVQVALRRSGQYMVDLAFQMRQFESFQRVAVPGVLSSEPLVSLVWEGILRRCRSYEVVPKRVNPEILAFELPDAGDASLPPLRTKDEFDAALQSATARFELETIQGDREPELFLPPSVAMQLLSRVAGERILDFSVGPATLKIPVPEWHLESEDWQRVAAAAANCCVTAGAVLGFQSDCSAPDEVYRRVLSKAGSALLAHRFNSALVQQGHWVLRLYNDFFVERCGGKPNGVQVDLRRGLKRALDRTQREMIGIDIGRTKIRAAMFQWDPRQHSWRAYGEKKVETPSGKGMTGILDTAASLVKQWTELPESIGVCWPGCVTSNGLVGGFSGIVADAMKPDPPYGVTTTTTQRLADFDIVKGLQERFKDSKIVATNDVVSWGMGLWAVTTNAMCDSEVERLSDDLLAPFGAAILGWVSE